MSIIIGIDHGYYAIKTAHCSFPAGLTSYGEHEPYTRQHAKSSVRAKVEHVFGVVKKQLRFRKTRYRGFEKQRAKCNMMFALADLLLADRPCLTA